MLKKGVIYKGKHGLAVSRNDWVQYKILDIIDGGWYRVQIIDEYICTGQNYKKGTIHTFHHEGCKDDKHCRELNVRELLKKLHENN